MCGPKRKKASLFNKPFLRWWGKKDSNLRSHTAAELQSAPFATRDTPPLSVIRPVRREAVGQPTMTLKSEPVHGRPVGAFKGEAAGESQPRRQLFLGAIILISPVLTGRSPKPAACRLP